MEDLDTMSLILLFFSWLIRVNLMLEQTFKRESYQPGVSGECIL